MELLRYFLVAQGKIIISSRRAGWCVEPPAIDRHKSYRSPTFFHASCREFGIIDQLCRSADPENVGVVQRFRSQLPRTNLVANDHSGDRECDTVRKFIKRLWFVTG